MHVTIYEVFKVVAACIDVVHTLFPKEEAHILVAIDLEGNRPEQTVSVPLHLFNHHLTLLLHFIPELFFFLVPELDELLLGQLILVNILSWLRLRVWIPLRLYTGG